MLRITVQERSSGVTLMLEGKLIGPWVSELEKTWCSKSADKRVQVDLSEVSFVDASGEALLAQMCRRGAELIADSPLMKQIIEEVTSGSGVMGIGTARSECFQPGGHAL